MVKVKIERYNNQLDGIGYVGGKIIFVPKTKVGDVVDVTITEEKTKYLRGKASSLNNTIDCPYFFDCGGCFLRHLPYDETIKLKYNNLKQLLINKNLYQGNIKVFENKNHYNYRNKISLKIKNHKVGFYEEKTNNIIEIDKCLIASNVINDFLSAIPNLKIKDGIITLRSNYNDELLISIQTKDDIKYDFNILKEDFKIAGVVINGEKVLNEDFIIDKIGETLFKISYDSFFQVNNYGAEKIIDVIKSNLIKSDNVLDLYCGVGTIGLSVSSIVNSVIGIEIVPNAIENALFNKRMNKIENAEFLLGDVGKTVDKIKKDFNAVIVDPPRAGLDDKTKGFIINSNPDKLIYVSCNPITLVRDLEELVKNYEIKNVSMVDMFSYSYHVESIIVLERKG